MSQLLTRRRYAIPVPLRRSTGRRIEWRVSSRTHLRFRELLTQLVELEYADQSDPETRERMAALRDDIRHLPGYPRTYHPERDVIVPIVTTAAR